MNDNGNRAASKGARGPMIEAIGLSKFFGEFVAIKEVSFSVARGEVCAFLGPNGAGKSTTMRLLTGYLAPTTGEARIAGFNVGTQRIAASQVIGYLPENGPLYNEMTPAGFLNYLGQARGMSSDNLARRMNFVQEKCALGEVWHKPIGKLSRGFRQRVGMAQAILHDPDVLILDEPTSGLDPNQVHEVRQLIRSLGATKTILLSTHILQEVTAVCGRVILINEGRIVFDGSTEEMSGIQHDMDRSFRELTSAGKSAH